MNANAFWRSIPAGSSAKVQLGGAKGDLELHGVCLQSGEEAVLMCKWGKQATPIRICRVTTAEPYCTVHARIDEEVEFQCSGGNVAVNGLLFTSPGGGSRKRARSAGATSAVEPTKKASQAAAPTPAAAKAEPKAEPKAAPKAKASCEPPPPVAKVDPKVAAQAQKEARDKEAAAAVAAGQQAAAKAAREAAAKAAAAKAPVEPQKRTLKGGVTYEVLKVGKGPPAQPGRRVKVKYDGRLAKNGKRFDRGSIDFKLGAGEVISGWDHGVKGMLRGEQRRLLIPAAMGYGARGAPPDIPPNAALTFEVELLQC